MKKYIDKNSVWLCIYVNSVLDFKGKKDRNIKNYWWSKFYSNQKKKKTLFKKRCGCVWLFDTYLVWSFNAYWDRTDSFRYAYLDLCFIFSCYMISDVDLMQLQRA